MDKSLIELVKELIAKILEILNKKHPIKEKDGQNQNPDQNIPETEDEDTDNPKQVDEPEIIEKPVVSQFDIVPFVNTADFATPNPNLDDIKNNGATGIALKVSRIPGSPYYFDKLIPDFQKKASNSGLKLFAWFSGNLNSDNTRMNSKSGTWDKTVAQMVVAVYDILKYKIPIIIDLDNGELSKNPVKTTEYIRVLNETIGGRVPLFVTVMPDAIGYDYGTKANYGEDYAALVPHVTALLPELYNMSYKADNTKLGNAVTKLVDNYPGKIVPVIQTIDDKGKKLTKSEIQDQIELCQKSGAESVFVFRWAGIPPNGLSSSQSSPTTLQDTYAKDKDGCYTSPRYHENTVWMKQADDTWCALNVIQQVYKELYNLDVLEKDLYSYGYTGSGGTAPSHLKHILLDYIRKKGHEVTIETYPFKSIGWEKIGQAVANPNIAVFFHELYQNKWGHYDYCVSVCPKNIYMANSLQGKVIGYPRVTMESWFNGIVSDNSIYLIKKVH